MLIVLHNLQSRFYTRAYKNSEIHLSVAILAEYIRDMIYHIHLIESRSTD